MQYPDVGEYDDAQKLALEKEVLGIYVSGHPLQKYMDSLEKQTTAKSTDFEPDEESGRAVVRMDSIMLLVVLLVTSLQSLQK